MGHRLSKIYTRTGDDGTTGLANGERVDKTDARVAAFGDVVAACWQELPDHYPGTQLDEFVVMPNHVHGILLLNQDGESNDRLSELVRAFKAFSTRRVNAQRAKANEPLWQRGYYEHIVRNERSLEKPRAYVVSNPARWDLDEDNPQRRVRRDP